jgi:hypothetical protein
MNDLIDTGVSITLSLVGGIPGEGSPPPSPTADFFVPFNKRTTTGIAVGAISNVARRSSFVPKGACGYALTNSDRGKVRTMALQGKGLRMAQTTASTTAGIDPRTISFFKKKRFLLEYTEDEFRDLVVRPVFLRKGLKDGRDLCGPTEEGKDCIFIARDSLGLQMLYAVQTKRGSINMSRTASVNVTEAITQLRTALETGVTLVASKERLFPSFVILCVSGQINSSAKNHIRETVQDPRVRFYDVDELVPEIDSLYPELWYGIDAKLFPYLKNLKDYILKASDTISLAELGINSDAGAPVTDESYTTLYLNRYTSETKRSAGPLIKGRRGTVRGAPVTETVPKVEQIPIHAVLGRKESLILLLGDAGFGKTTALRRFAYSLADKALQSTEKTEIPVLLRATDISKTQNRVVDLAAEATATLSGTGKHAFDSTDLVEGRLLLFVDALDEIASDITKGEVISRLLAFNKDYPDCKVILTSRPSSFTTNNVEIKSFTRFRVNPVDIKQVEKMVARLVKGKSLPEESTQEMLRKLQDVHGIDLNPLLITVFVATSDYTRRDLPANITEVFKKFTEMMLGRWDERKGLSQQYQSALKDFLLRRLAFEMHSEGITAISLQRCKALMETELRDRGRETDLDVLLDEILFRSGLLRLDDGIVEFRHFLLQEFFAGRGIPSQDFLKGAVADEWWRSGVVFYFGEHPDAHSELASLIPGLDTLSGADLYHASIAVGLAMQACYLSKTAEKEATLQWVIEALARAQSEYLKSLDEQKTAFPLHNFLYYYLQGRDAVASEVITGIAKNALEKMQSGSGTPQSEMSIFWTIVGLIETDQLQEAAVFVKDFHPSDLRVLLAIHLGCFLVANLRISKKAEKDAAHRICARVGPKITSLRLEILREWKGILLEMRQGTLHVLDAVVGEPSPKKVGKNVDTVDADEATESL